MTTCMTATDTFGADGNVVLLERGTKLIGETRGQVQQGIAARVRAVDARRARRRALSCRSIRRARMSWVVRDCRGRWIGISGSDLAPRF